MFDTVVVLDSPARWCCPEGHALGAFKTKDLVRPGFNAYLVHGGKLYLASSEHELDDESQQTWRIEGQVAVRERRYRLHEVEPPRSLRIYGSCSSCEPVLVRGDGLSDWGDIVNEHAVFVDFRLTFRPGEPLQIEPMSGTREAFKQQLRQGGAFVLDDADPLVAAHRALRLARPRATLSRAAGLW